MFFFHNNIKKNGVICLLLLLDVCLLSSCKTNNVVKAKIATINNECIRNVVDNMLSFADSITDCKYDYYYLIKNQDEKEESYTLQSTNIQEIYSHFGKTTLLMDTLGGHILLFPEKTVDYVGGYGKIHLLKTIIDDKNNSTDKFVGNEDLTFDGCEDVIWHFNYNNNRIQVIDINNYRMNLNDWLIYEEDSLCFDNPLRNQIEFIEDAPSNY